MYLRGNTTTAMASIQIGHNLRMNLRQPGFGAEARGIATVWQFSPLDRAVGAEACDVRSQWSDIRL
jgi:hypothetical protein